MIEAVSAQRRALTPHQKIMRAAKRGTGLRLTADEIYRLSLDSAIENRAVSDDLGESDPSALDMAWRAR